MQLIYIFFIVYAGPGWLLTIFFKWHNLGFGFIRSEIFLARPEGKLSAITISRSKKKTSLEIHFSHRISGLFFFSFYIFRKKNWNISVFITFWSPLFVKTKGKCLIFYFKNLNFCVLSLAKIHIYISSRGGRKELSRYS